MFEVKECNRGRSFYISERIGVSGARYLHCDGSMLPTLEYWPTREQALAVLDKHYPPHVWKHGDVFKNCGGSTWIYLEPGGKRRVLSLDRPSGDGPIGSTPEVQLDPNVNATFLFNIREKI